MKNIDKLHKIKDFLNRVLKEVYGVRCTGLIDDTLYYVPSKRAVFPENKNKYVIQCTNQIFYINYWIGISTKPLDEICSRLLNRGIPPREGQYKNLRIGRSYNMLKPFFNYSDEELKLYFKLAS